MAAPPPPEPAPSVPQATPLQGRVAIVTGASRGIGREIATHLASLGANLVLGYATNSAQADHLASQLNSGAPDPTVPRAVTVRVDVSNPDDVKSLFDRAESAFGVTGAHILVNCAGVLDEKYPSIAATSLEDFDSTFAVNTRGSFLCCREAASRLVRGGGGRIIMLSSSMVGGLRPGYGAYAASKAAVETMVRILAKELKGTRITANCVAPGPVASDMFYAGKTDQQIKAMEEATPSGRIGEPRDVAPLVGFLAGDAGEWINGQVVRVNGGFVI